MCRRQFRQLRDAPFRRFGSASFHLHRLGFGPGEFSTPHAVCVDRQNRVLVVDRENGRVQIFDREGQHLESWEHFYNPMDITEDDMGRIYVSNQVPSVSQFDAAGTLVGRARPAWNVPHGITCVLGGGIFVAEINPRSLPSRVREPDESGG